MKAANVSRQLDDTTMEETLMKADGEGPFTAVVMVAGSGSTAREWFTVASWQQWQCEASRRGVRSFWHRLFAS